VGSDFFLVVFLVVWVLSRWFAGLSFFVTLEEYWGCLFGLLIIYYRCLFFSDAFCSLAWPSLRLACWVSLQFVVGT